MPDLPVRARARLGPFFVPLLLLLGAACAAPRSGVQDLAAQPGWGRRHVPEAERISVRAVPASAAPRVPETRLGKPGWGRATRPR